MGFFRHRDGLWPNFVALAYAFGAYVVGWYLITRDPWWLNAAGVILLAHAMIIAAYLVHECAHNTLFARNDDNARMGKMLLWITGACYGTYEGIRHKHFRHHVDRADVVAFNFRLHLLRYPILLRVLQTLEFLFIPALDIVMHGMVPLMPFVLPTRRADRARVVAIVIIRTLVFGAIAVQHPEILLLYPLAYMIMLHVLRFMDAFQHTYALFETLEQAPGPEAKQFDVAFEHSHTFSNPHSVRHPWLNLLTLNFGYHNAHHKRPTQPWYRLPVISRELFGENFPQLLPLRYQLRNYVNHRVARLIHEDPIDLDVFADDGKNFVGVDGVSFLTGH
jgi:fatty acid desaturase